MRSGVVVLAVMLAFSSQAAHTQTTTVSSGPERKITARVAPAYPELAEAIVRPNGTVKSTRVLGGNPVLVEAAQDAVGKWKFEPAASETTEIAQVAFEAQ